MNTTKPQTLQSRTTPQSKKGTTATQLSPTIIAKMEETAKQYLPQTNLELNQSVTLAYWEGEETVVIMTCKHSMLMNCVPLMKEQLGADVLKKFVQFP